MNRKENEIINPRFTLRLASSDETGLFYTLSKEQNEKLGTIGHLRIDFGSNGYIIETERYRYCLRCNPALGDYQAYLTVYDLKVQQMNLNQEASALSEAIEQTPGQGITLGGM
ncbi:hypothetical protein [Lacrimispora sp.]|uniref:hypothetical protein n=1 Tax=Lacrimispora sp. TaxID=2719234 RepID=UPI0028A779CB|nr:hypothetical protein [Lacrimispora sp.]